MVGRRGHRSAISLFAFQDVMASVIGILFMIVLLVSLDIANAASPDRLRESAQLAEEAKALRGETAALEAEITSSAAHVLEASAADDRAVLSDLITLDRTLRSMYARIAQEQEALEQLRAAADRAFSQREQRAQRIEALAADRAEIEAKIAHAGNAPRVAFIIDQQPDGMKPWLAEVAASGIRVALAEDPSAVMEFEGERDEAFLSWARGRDKTRQYFVVLIKPSGCQRAVEIEERLERLGFELGRDLIPETWKPF